MIEGPKRSAASIGHRPSRIAVFVHVHYLDVWNDILGLLEERLQTPFHLFITTSLPMHDFAEPKTPFHEGTTIIKGENRGRDIRPFLIALSSFGDFDIGLKLHTKKSIHRLDGKNWRDDMLSSLLPPAPATMAIVEALNAHPKIGLIAPTGFLLNMRDWVMANRPSMERVAVLLSILLERSDWSDGLFAAGSMFWFRRDAIAPIIDHGMLDLFEEERGQTDGTLAHAIERLFGLIAVKRGYSILPAHSVSFLSEGMSVAELNRLGRKESRQVSPLFKTQAWLKFVARHAPFFFKIYGLFPNRIRKGVRDLLIRD